MGFGYRDRVFTGMSRFAAGRTSGNSSAWSLVNFNGDGILDLVQIMYGDARGKVRVRVASG